MTNDTDNDSPVSDRPGKLASHVPEIYLQDFSGISYLYKINCLYMSYEILLLQSGHA
jgi:hypothetical protein